MNEEKWEAAVAKMAEMTAAGGIRWLDVPEAVPHCDEGTGVRGVPYLAYFHNKQFLVYQFDCRIYHDEDSWIPASDVAIEIVDEKFAMQFRLPKVPSRWALMQAIRAKVSGADDFLDKFLSEGQ